MKQKILSILLLIFFFGLVTHAQDEGREYEQSIKFYSSFQYLFSGNMPNYYLDPSSFSFNSASIGCYREKKSESKFIEVSLSFFKRSTKGSIIQTTVDTSTISNPPLMFTTNIYSGISDDLNIGLRFEKGRWIDRLSTSNLKIGFSTAVRTFVHFSNFDSFDAGFYSRDREQYFLVLGFVPRIKYNLTSKFYLALQFPFELVGIGLDFEEIGNPVLSASQQRQGGFNFNIGGEALIRLGVGYNF